MITSDVVEILHIASSASDREAEVKGVTHSGAADFIKYILNNPHEREKLQDATAAEIVQAGQVAGYDFTESDLDVLIERFITTSTMPIAKLQCHADSEGNGGVWDKR